MAAGAGIGFTGCSDPAAVRPAAAVDLVESIASVNYGDTLRLGVTVIDADSNVLRAADVEWSSSDPEIATVSVNGKVTGVWPGHVVIRAQSGVLSDSMSLVVQTTWGGPSDCGLTWNPLEDHGFHFLSVRGGSFWNVGEGIPTYFTFHGVRLLHNAGLMFGTSAENMLVARNSLAGDDMNSASSCVVPEPTGWHTVGLMQAPGSSVNSPLAIPGLTVIQEAFALAGALNQDYVLMRYTFTNDGDVPITGLRVGVLADFDVGDAQSNVGSWNAALNAAEVVAADSIANPAVGGITLVGVTTESYRTTFPFSGRRTRAQFFDYLATGSDGTGRTPVEDARQLLGAPPFDLDPGQSRSIWYAIAGGLTRSAFETAMGRAVDAADFLENQGH